MISINKYIQNNINKFKLFISKEKDDFYDNKCLIYFNFKILIKWLGNLKNNNISMNWKQYLKELIN